MSDSSAAATSPVTAAAVQFDPAVLIGPDSCISGADVVCSVNNSSLPAQVAWRDGP